MRIQISDTHISHLGGVTSRNFSLLVDFVNSELRPDLIVNSGDVSILSPDSALDREAARKLHEGFTAPVRVLPGNHDLGEAGDHPWMGLSVTSERLAAFATSFGTDHFMELTDDNWAIIGMNSEILSSDLPEEQEQWTWLEEGADEVVGRSLLLFLHKPLWSPMPEYTEHALAIDARDRDRLLALFSRSSLRAVGSGHLHAYKTSWQAGILAVWAPSSAFVVKGSPEMDGTHLASLGLSQLGVVEYRIEGDSIDTYFRSIPTLCEEEPWGMPEFVETLAMIERERERVSV